MGHNTTIFINDAKSPSLKQNSISRNDFYLEYNKLLAFFRY